MSDVAAEKIGVLLIDFHTSSRAFFTTILGRADGFQVWTASSPEEAMSTAESIWGSAVHFLILDLGFLSEKENHVFVQKLFALPVIRKAHLLVMAENVEADDAVLFEELGVKKVLPRMMGGGTLLGILREIFGGIKGREETFSAIAELSKAIQEDDSAHCDKLMCNEALVGEVKSSPDHAHLYAEYLMLNKRDDEAADFLRIAVKNLEGSGKQGGTLRCLASLGKVLCRQKRFKEALTVFETLSQKSPKNLMHVVLKAETNLESGNVQVAKVGFQEVLEIDPENVAAHVGMSKVHLVNKDFESAFSELSKVNGAVESSSLASYFNNAGVALIHENRTIEALGFLERAVPIFDRFRPIVLFNMGMTYLRIGDYSQAARIFDEVLAKNQVELIERKKVLLEYKKDGIKALQKYGK